MTLWILKHARTVALTAALTATPSHIRPMQHAIATKDRQLRPANIPLDSDKEEVRVSLPPSSPGGPTEFACFGSTKACGKCSGRLCG
jgi:hypothetical protein